ARADATVGRARAQSRRASQHHVDLLLPVGDMVVLGITAAVRFRLEHIHSPGGTSHGTGRLAGSGRILGGRFKPAAVRRVTQRRADEFTDKRVPLARALDVDARRVEADVLAPTDDAGRVARIEAFLRARWPAPDPRLETSPRWAISTNRTSRATSRRSSAV